MQNWQLCEHLWVDALYNNNRKNPPIHYINIFANPIVKIPSPKKTAFDSCLFYFLFLFFLYLRKIYKNP